MKYVSSFLDIINSKNEKKYNIKEKTNLKDIFSSSEGKTSRKSTTQNSIHLTSEHIVAEIRGGEELVIKLSSYV
jgi:hypothetical protein